MNIRTGKGAVATLAALAISIIGLTGCAQAAPVPTPVKQTNAEFCMEAVGTGASPQTEIDEATFKTLDISTVKFCYDHFDDTYVTGETADGTQIDLVAPFTSSVDDWLNDLLNNRY